MIDQAGGTPGQGAAPQSGPAPGFQPDRGHEARPDRGHDPQLGRAQSSGTGASPIVAAPDRRLIISLGLNLLITLLQVVGGIVANSLGLLSDAAHNLSDVVALGLSLWAVHLGRRGSTPRRTFAFKRAEILVALFNSAVLVAVSLYIIVEAVRRLLDPQPVQGMWVISFAAGGLVINALAAGLLRAYHRDLNLRSAFLHLVGDAVTSFGVMVGGLVVYLWGWNYADAIVSILVSLWIGKEAVAIVRSTVNVLMEGTPEGVEFSAVETAMLAVEGVEGVHDLHIWSISSSDLALSAHVEVEDVALSETSALVAVLKDMLAQDFGVGHATLELEMAGGECSGSTCALPPANLNGGPTGDPSGDMPGGRPADDHRSGGHQAARHRR